MKRIDEEQISIPIAISFALISNATMKTVITLITKSSKFIIPTDTNLNFAKLTLIRISDAILDNFVPLHIIKLK
jgi:hypothetical protein